MCINVAQRDATFKGDRDDDRHEDHAKDVQSLNVGDKIEQHHGLDVWVLEVVKRADVFIYFKCISGPGGVGGEIVWHQKQTRRVLNLLYKHVS